MQLFDIIKAILIYVLANTLQILQKRFNWLNYNYTFIFHYGNFSILLLLIVCELSLKLVFLINNFLLLTLSHIDLSYIEKGKQKKTATEMLYIHKKNNMNLRLPHCAASFNFGDCV